MNSRAFIFIIFISSLFFSCQKGISWNLPSPPQPGAVKLFTENNIPDDYFSNVIINVSNGSGSTNFAPNVDGSFTLPKLNDNGDVTFSFSNPSYGTIKKYFSETAVDSMENGYLSLPNATLYQVSTIELNSIKATLVTDTFKIICNVSCITNSLNAVRFFIQKNNKNVAYNNSPSLQNATLPVAVKNGDNYINICTSCEVNNGFNSGDTLYIKAYADISADVHYTDINSNLIVFPCVNPVTRSSTLSFIVP